MQRTQQRLLQQAIGGADALAGGADVLLAFVSAADAETKAALATMPEGMAVEEAATPSTGEGAMGGGSTSGEEGAATARQFGSNGLPPLIDVPVEFPDQSPVARVPWPESRGLPLLCAGRRSLWSHRPAIT